MIDLFQTTAGSPPIRARSGTTRGRRQARLTYGVPPAYRPAMYRRRFALTSPAGVLAAPLAAKAQQGAKPLGVSLIPRSCCRQPLRWICNAEALGLTIPPALLARADQVIE